MFPAIGIVRFDPATLLGVADLKDAIADLFDVVNRNGPKAYVRSAAYEPSKTVNTRWLCRRPPRGRDGWLPLRANGRD